MNSLDFLQRILPSAGVFFVGTRSNNKKFPHSYFPTITDLAEWLDKQGAHDDVYFACASYKQSGDKKTRKLQDVEFAKAFWLDIDIRPDSNSAYGNASEFSAALGTFVKSYSLPLPFVVFTGGGFHLYWPLDRDIPYATWRPIADGLKQACKNVGFKADPKRTSDITSILRPVGSLNHKYPQKPEVVAVHEAGPYPLAAFQHLASLAPKLEETQSTAPVKNLGKLKDNMEKERRRLFDIVPIHRQCHQLQYFFNGGHQSEPVWVGCSRLLSECQGGRELWHKYSSLDPRYDFDEAEKKFQEARAFGQGSTCQYFKDIAPDICNGCTYTGGRPLFIAEEKAITIDTGGLVLPALNHPYEFDAKNRMVKKLQQKESEDTKPPLVIHDFPVIVSGINIGERGTTDYSFTLKTYIRGQWKEHTISALEFGSNPTKALATANILPRVPEELHKCIRQEHAKMYMEQATTKIYETFGWKTVDDKPAFLWGNRLYHLDDNGEPTYKTVTVHGDAVTWAGRLRPGGAAGGGSAASWREAAQSFMAPGHEWQAIALFSGFAAPLMHFGSSREGGLVTSLTESLGGAGKTTATQAAASIWGEPEALNCSPADTPKSRFTKIAILGNLPVTFDEMQRDNTDVCLQFMQRFTAGQEGTGLTTEGKIRREPRHWKTILITNANNELAGMIRSGLGSHAMADRILEINATRLPTNGKKLRDSIKEAFATNCGYAGEIFIQACLLKLEGIKQAFPIATDHYMGQLKGTKDRFLAQYLAAMDIAMRIVKGTDLLSFEPDSYIRHILNYIQEDKNEAPTVSYYDLLGMYVRDNAGSTLVTVKYVPNKKQTIYKELKGQKLKIRYEIDTNEMLIPSQDFNLFLTEHRRSLREFRREMIELHIMKKGDTTTRRVVGAGTAHADIKEHCYVLDMSDTNLFEDLLLSSSVPSEI